MARWSPVTKAAIALGVVAVPVLLLTEAPQGGRDAVVGPSHAAVSARQEEPARMETPQRVDLGLLPPVEVFAAMVERPLFAPSRRPARPPAPVVVEETYEPAADAPLEPGVLFVGTIRRGSQVLALAHDAQSGAVMTLAVGDEVNGWQVLAVEDQALDLGAAGERRRLAMFEPRDPYASGASGMDAFIDQGDEPYPTHDEEPWPEDEAWPGD